MLPDGLRSLFRMEREGEEERLLQPLAITVVPVNQDGDVRTEGEGHSLPTGGASPLPLLSTTEQCCRDAPSKGHGGCLPPMTHKQRRLLALTVSVAAGIAIGAVEHIPLVGVGPFDAASLGLTVLFVAVAASVFMFLARDSGRHESRHHRHQSLRQQHHLLHRGSTAPCSAPPRIPTAVACTAVTESVLVGFLCEALQLMLHNEVRQGPFAHPSCFGLSSLVTWMHS